MRLRAPSIRKTLTVSVAVLATLTIVVVCTLLILTSYLHRASLGLGAAVETVRLAEEAEVDLLLHPRTTDPLARANLEGQLRQRFVEVEELMPTEPRRPALREAAEAVDRYLAAVHAPEASSEETARLHQAAYASLERLVGVNVAHARELTRTTAGWDRFANVLGLGVGTAFVIAIVALLWWLNTAAFRPVLTLSRAMERFGEGEGAARAAEEGPGELQAMAARFNQMAQSIEAQRERQQAFLAGVAHDLRNPLSALQMSTSVVSPEEPLPDEASVRHALSVVERQVWRMDRMLNDFLDTAMIEAGRLHLHIERLDVREVVREVVDLFEASSVDHELTLVVPDEPLWVRGDATRISQVLANLVSNAIKYSPKGGDVRVSARSASAEALLTVEDTGSGIPPDEVDGLFQPFHRGRLRAAEIPGVGLGLFVARRIVDAHRGRIEVESTPGEGSRFTVALPLASAAQTGATQEAVRERRTGRSANLH